MNAEMEMMKNMTCNEVVNMHPGRGVQFYSLEEGLNGHRFSSPSIQALASDSHECHVTITISQQTRQAYALLKESMPGRECSQNLKKYRQ